MADADFARLGLIYSGNALAKITSLEMMTDAGLQRVDTLIEGFTGWSDGSGSVTLTIGFVIPIGGPEAEFQQHCARKEIVECEFFVGALTYVGRGKVKTVRFSQSVNAAAEGTAEWEGQIKPIEA